MAELQTLNGGCHCGNVRFAVQSAWPAPVDACNCSICEAVGYLHLIVPDAQFKLLTDWQHLHLYTFNSGIAQHWFCTTCGIKSFYKPRSHPDSISVNGRCLDDVDLGSIEIRPFDGRNWEQNVAELRSR